MAPLHVEAAAAQLTSMLFKTKVAKMNMLTCRLGLYKQLLYDPGVGIDSYWGLRGWHCSYWGLEAGIVHTENLQLTSVHTRYGVLQVGIVHSGDSGVGIDHTGNPEVRRK